MTNFSDDPMGNPAWTRKCGSQVLVYGECGLMTGASPWDEPLSQRPNLKTSEFSAYASKLGELAIRLKEMGITLAYHHHLKMLVERAEEIDAFCQSTRDEVGLLLDTGHAYAAGADYAEIIRKFGSSEATREGENSTLPIA